MAFDLKIADIARDGQLVQMARDEAQKVIEEDPDCQLAKYQLLGGPCAGGAYEYQLNIVSGYQTQIKSLTLITALARLQG